jgi:hypothetical protein
MKKEEEGVLWSFHQWMKGDIRGSPFFWKNSWAWCQFWKAIEFGVKVCGALEFHVFFLKFLGWEEAEGEKEFWDFDWELRYGVSGGGYLAGGGAGGAV